MRSLWEQRRGRLSAQVLSEFYVNVTRKLKPGLPPASARRIVESFLPWEPVVTDEQLLGLAWNIEDDSRLSWWDALIVAAAQAASCRYLLTEDLGDGQTYGSVQVVHPFRTEPAALA
jgi:predicted nucleic acid-binding protein